MSALPDAALVVTGRSGHAADLAASASARGFDPVVAAGGDGTVAEVASGLLDSGSSARLGILPFGTGNDLARALGIPATLRRALRLLRGGGTRPLDAARIVGAEVGAGPRWMLNALVAGFAGGIADRIDARVRRRWGRLVYARAALSELRDVRPRWTRLVVDGGPALELETLMVAVANGPFAGGRLPLAPRARPDDGRLDLLVVPRMPAAAFAVEIVRALAFPRRTGRRLVRLQARSVLLELRPPGPCNVDGETWRPGPVRLETVPAALRVIAPAPRVRSGNGAAPSACPRDETGIPPAGARAAPQEDRSSGPDEREGR